MGISIKAYLEVVKVFDLEEIRAGEHGPNFRFRIEILKEYKSKKRYRVRVYRKETFRILPTFPQKGGKPQNEPSDELLYIEDQASEWDKISASSSQSVLNKTLATLRRLTGSDK